jgi:hypothetical protein
MKSNKARKRASFLLPAGHWHLQTLTFNWATVQLINTRLRQCDGSLRGTKFFSSW